MGSTCKYCGKPCKSRIGLASHEQTCNLNPDKINGFQQLNLIQEVQCKYCGKLCKNINSLFRHETTCVNNPEYDAKKFQCKFCGRYSPTNYGLTRHEKSCKLNPERIAGKSSWNKGLTKDTDDRILKKAEKAVEYYKTRPGTFTGKKHTEEYKQKMSDLAFEREIGGFHFRRGIMYNGIKLDSSYEVIVAKSLDANNILWQRCQRFKYLTPSGELHHYTPDFYLPHYNVYLDPKNDFLIENINPFTGYNDIDKINWVMQQNDIRILVLDKDHLDWQSIKKLIDEK